MKKTFMAFGVVTMLGTGGIVAVDQSLVNPYIDEDTHYELAIKNDIQQGERVEIDKNRAEMTLKGWNDEYTIKIIPQIPTSQLGVVDRPFIAKAVRPFLSKKMEYRNGDVSTFIEPKTNNEFDIDFILYSKPDTNVFTYKVVGAEDFDFFYQPELTPDEISEGATRPENVVGSYAVYSKNKINHRIGSTNYATGKVLHLYRPKVIDANGVETWAQLHYGSGILSVSVPQQFLNDAIYPVRVDPTFGYTTCGGTSVLISANDRLQGRTGNPGESGTVSGVSVCASMSAGTGLFRGAVYASTTDALLSPQGAETSVTGTSNVFWESVISTGPSISAQNYFASVFVDAPTPNTFNLRQDSGGTLGDSRFVNGPTVVYPTFPDPWGTKTNSVLIYSIYATYTVSASGGTPNPQSGKVQIFAPTIINSQTIIQ